MRPLITRAAVVTGAAAVLFGSAAGVANASPPSATLQFHNQLQLQADGTVLVTIDYSCNPGLFGTSGTFEVEVDQPETVGLTYGQPATCDGQKHIVTVGVGPAAGYGPYTLGSASVAAEVISNSGTSSAQAQAALKVIYM
jgi:hypothetical protein